MTQRSMRRIAVAVVLAAATVLAAPAQAAGRTTLGATGSDWLEAAIQWMMGVSSGDTAAVSAPGIKAAPVPSPPTVTAPPPAKTDSGFGIDPDG
jgi:hypothetical protein